jgi:iron complex transport system substrate-binding protein
VDAPASVASPRRRPRRPALAALLAVVSLLAACSTPGTERVSIPPDATGSAAPVATGTPTPAPSAAGFPVTLTDDEGTAVEIPAEPRRIVSLTPATTEILFAIGAGDRVVATTDFDDYPPEAVELPDVASFTAVDVEKIVGLEADLVIAGGNNFNDPQAIERLRSLGVPVVVTYAPDLDTVLRDIELVGRAAGRPAEAAELAAGMREEIDTIAAAVADLDRPRVFYELDATQEIFTAADDSFLEEMIELAGGDPITTGSTTSFSIPLERLVAADPEVILLGDAAYGVTPETVAERPGWAEMTAVRESAIRPVDDIVITRPGPRLVEGFRQLTEAIHPDAELPAG